VPKKLLLENGAPTAADKRHLNEGIEECHWLAALKPTTIGVSVYRDEQREYLEIAVLRLTLRPQAKTSRLVELVHRAVPYPVLLLADCDGLCAVSAAHKRWSQGEAGQTVLDGPVVAVDGDAGEYGPAFREALGLGRQPRADMRAVYQGWIDALLALQAAGVTGRFILRPTREQAQARALALAEYARLEGEIARLRAAAAREVQIPRQVDLNLEIKRLQAAQDDARRKL
jgi:hypothetical protein